MIINAKDRTKISEIIVVPGLVILEKSFLRLYFSTCVGTAARKGTLPGVHEKTPECECSGWIWVWVCFLWTFTLWALFPVQKGKKFFVAIKLSEAKNHFVWKILQLDVASTTNTLAVDVPSRIWCLKFPDPANSRSFAYLWKRCHHACWASRVSLQNSRKVLPSWISDFERKYRDHNHPS